MLSTPAWQGEDTCKGDGKQPDYMTNSPSTWMTQTLEECCLKNFPWNYEYCVEEAPAPTLLCCSGRTGWGCTESALPAGTTPDNKSCWLKSLTKSKSYRR